jgi:hypothetical protein
MRPLLLIGLVVISAFGCGGTRFAPVSGKVMMDGKPLPNASVTFTPVAQPGSTEAGVSSTGKTNQNGEYSLTAATGKSGAQVGQHVVSISVLNPQIGEGDERPPRGGWPLANKVPVKYNEKSELTYDVPSGGGTNADFTLSSK